MIDRDLARARQPVDGRLDERRGDAELLTGLLDQAGAGQVDVALAPRFLERGTNARFEAHLRLLADPERGRHAIRGDEADTPHVEGQAVRVLAHPGHGVRSVALVDAQGQPGRHAVALQEDHDLALSSLGAPGLADGPGARVSDPGHLAEALGVLVEDLEGLLPEAGDHAPRELGADALDEPAPR